MFTAASAAGPKLVSGKGFFSNVVPALFVVATWRVIVNANFVENIAVEFGVKLGLKNVIDWDRGY